MVVLALINTRRLKKLLLADLMEHSHVTPISVRLLHLTRLVPWSDFIRKMLTPQRLILSRRKAEIYIYIAISDNQQDKYELSVFAFRYYENDIFGTFPKLFVSTLTYKYSSTQPLRVFFEDLCRNIE